MWKWWDGCGVGKERSDSRVCVQATIALALSLGAFGIAYVLTVLLAGDNPPGFLLDIVPAGLRCTLNTWLLWHLGTVVVSTWC